MAPLAAKDITWPEKVRFRHHLVGAGRNDGTIISFVSPQRGRGAASLPIPFVREQEGKPRTLIQWTEWHPGKWEWRQANPNGFQIQRLKELAKAAGLLGAQ